MKLDHMFRGQINELVERAGVGIGSWNDLAVAICEALPGSFCGVNNQDKRTGELSFGTFEGLPDEGKRNYVEHFCRVNPLNAGWKGLRPGQFAETEEILPVSTIVDTEFYADFLAKYGNFRIGMGVKIAEDESNELVMPVHFSSTVRHVYEPVVRELLSGLAPSLMRAGELNRHFADVVNRALRLGALSTYNGDIAFILDRTLTVVEASARAMRAEGQPPFGIWRDKLSLADSKAQIWLQASVRAILTRHGDYDSRYYLATGGDRWQLMIAALPGREHRGALDLFGLTRYVLLVARKTGSPIKAEVADFLQSQFELTPAETRIAMALARGCDVASISVELGVSNETVRTHLKSVFAKTGTGRQSELVAIILQII